MRFWPTLCTVALLSGLSGCDHAPADPVSTAGRFAGSEAEDATAAAAGPTVQESLLYYGGRPTVTDARLLYLAAYQQQVLGQPDALSPAALGQRLAAHARRALSGDPAALARHPPLLSLLSMTVGARDHSLDFGPLYAREILRRPSLTLLGTVPAAGAQPGTPAYGARLEPLFVQGARLLQGTSLACEPARPAADAAATDAGGRLADPHYWVANVIHQQSYACARRVAPADGHDPLGLYQVGVAAFPVHEAPPAVTRDFGYAGITGTLAQAGDPLVIVTLPWLDEFPHLGGDQAAWTLLDELQAALPTGWYYLLSAAPPGVPGGDLTLYAGRQEDGAVTPTALGALPY